MDNVLTNVLSIIVMPLQRVITLLWSIEVGDTNLGALILIGVLFAVLIEIVVHAHGFSLNGIYHRNKGEKND